MLMSLKMKSKHLVPDASAPILFFFVFFSKPFSSLKLSFDSGSVMNQPQKRSNRLKALYGLYAFPGFQA